MKQKLYVRREWGIQRINSPHGVKNSDGKNFIDIQLNGRWTIRKIDGSFINSYKDLNIINDIYGKTCELVIFNS